MNIDKQHTQLTRDLLNADPLGERAKELRAMKRRLEGVKDDLERAYIEEMIARLKEKYMPLSTIIRDLLLAASRTGEAQRKPLPRGAMLHAKNVNGTTSIGISRGDVYPSLAEWRAVLNALPYPISIKNPLSARSQDGRYLLYAEWPTPKQIRAL